MNRPDRFVSVQQLAALKIAYLGWSALALAEREKVPLAKSHGAHDGTRDTSAIELLWTKHPHANVGIATGKPSGLWVLDVDGDEGIATMASLVKQHGELPSSPRSRTGSGGVHVFFALPPEREVRNRIKFAPGCDTRSTGGYVVAPPSVHPNGNAYRWIAGHRPDDVRLALAPAWLLDLVAPLTAPAPLSPPPAAPRPLVGHSGASVVDRARGYLARVPAAVSGQGGHAITFAVARALVTGFCLDAATSLSLLAEWNRMCLPPWGEKELAHKIQSAIDTPSERQAGYLLHADRRVA